MNVVDYDFRVIEPTEANADAIDAWFGAIADGFHDPRPNEEMRKIVRETNARDNARMAGAWLPEGEYGAGLRPVATFASFTKTLNAGAEVIALHMITDITVSPAHRRRGLLKRLMTEDLALATAPVAALTVSEASIYGRFGFGPATFRRRLEVDTTAKFQLRGFTDPGRVELMDPHVSWDLLDEIFQRFHAQTRGSVARPSFYEKFLTGLMSFATGSKDDALRGAVHLDASGTPDGYVLYKPGESEPGKPKPVDADLLALNNDAHLGLWQFLAGIDLTALVRVRSGHPEDTLPWSLTNSDVVSLKGQYDHIWIRVLDVPAALAARPWYADDEIVLRVDDPVGHADGVFRIAAREGRAEVTPTDGEAEVTLSAETLGALYLGGTRVDTLHRAGRITGSADAVARFGRLMDGGPAPYSMTSF